MLGCAAACLEESSEVETGNAQLKTHLRGPGRVLRSRSPDMVRQEIYGYLLTHYAISAPICKAATEAGIDPDQVKLKRTVRIVGLPSTTCQGASLAREASGSRGRGPLLPPTSSLRVGAPSPVLHLISTARGPRLHAFGAD